MRALAARHVKTEARMQIAAVGELHEDEERRHHWAEWGLLKGLEPRVHIADDVFMLERLQVMHLLQHLW